MAQRLFGTARELGIPVMSHTCNGQPNALPSLRIPMARKYPYFEDRSRARRRRMFGADTLVTAEQSPNIYRETSWTAIYDLKAMIRKLGPKRIVFGTDLLCNMQVELAKYRGQGLDDASPTSCLARPRSQSRHQRQLISR